MSDEIRQRLRYALERVRGYPVKVITNAEWRSRIRTGGEPTKLPSPLSPYQPGLAGVEIVTIAASTQPAVGTPGYHHVRLDPKDAPNIFNTDSFDAIEDLRREPDFPQVCQAAGLSPSAVGPAILGYVFLLGPKKRADHHSPHVPADIDGARQK